MTIDPDVAAVALHWGQDPTLLQAVCLAEGNILKAAQCSVPGLTTRAQALEVLARSATHAQWLWIRAGAVGGAAGFVAFFGARWAPQGVTNDPRGLNANWAGNVLALWMGHALAEGPRSPGPTNHSGPPGTLGPPGDSKPPSP